MSDLRTYMLFGILGMGVVTFLIRVLPFFRIVPRFILERLEQKPTLFPTLFLTLLVIYCLSPVRHLPRNEALYLFGSSALVAVVHWFRGNLILSLGIGTAVYLYLLNGL